MITKIFSVKESFELTKLIARGEVVGFPTETVYGLAIIFDNEDSFKKLVSCKCREITKPISLMVSKNYDLNKIAYVTDRAKKIINAFMPGAITIILKAKENLPSHVTMGRKTIGIRIPTNDVALQILEDIKKPLLVTSANVSSCPSLMKYQDVYETFNGKIAGLISEDAINGVASTVVDISDENNVTILREGPITLEKIMKVLKE